MSALFPSCRSITSPPAAPSAPATRITIGTSAIEAINISVGFIIFADSLIVS
jgi:hypothetical protein